MSEPSFEVKFGRTRQAQQYEPEYAEVKAVTFGHEVDPDALLDRCKASVYRVLGLKVAEKVPQGAGEAVQKPITRQEASSQTGTGATGGAEVVTSPAGSTPAAEKRRPGRPSKADQAAAKKLADEALNNPASTDPMAEVITPAISKGDDHPREQSDDPMADVVSQQVGENAPVDDMGIPVVTPVDAKKYTDLELQNAAGLAVQRTGNSKLVREVIAKYAPKVQEIKPEDRGQFIADLKALSANPKK